MERLTRCTFSICVNYFVLSRAKWVETAESESQCIIYETMHAAAFSPTATGIIYQLSTESSHPDKLPSLSATFSGFSLGSFNILKHMLVCFFPNIRWKGRCQLFICTTELEPSESRWRGKLLAWLSKKLDSLNQGLSTCNLRTTSDC